MKTKPTTCNLTLAESAMFCFLMLIPIAMMIGTCLSWLPDTVQ